MVATSSPDASTTIQTAADSLKPELLEVAGIGLGVGVAIFALRKGWSLLRGFVS